MNAVMHRFETILTMEYDINNYMELTREIFPQMKVVAPERFRPERTNFSSHIEGSTHVGSYTSPDNEDIIIMAVQLKNARYVEGSRSTQRSYAKKLIENANADAAFIAFYTDGDPKWRLSLVRLDFEMKFENGQLKAAENITPAKRYSYLVGKDEPCHTAISRFGRFISEGTVQISPTLKELEEAFSVEKVTNEFFELYSEKFHQLRESLEANNDFCIEAEQHNFTSAQFAKKLMGQIVFLYFLQKKGWLGVGAWPNRLSEKEYKNAFFARGAKSRELIPKVYVPAQDGYYYVSSKGLDSISDEDEEVLASCVKGRPWGTGPKNFMRKLFELAERRKENFFDDILEPLFYNALNVNRGEQGYCPALHCRIPFLSGGLFEPIDGYDWEHNDFNLPNEIFSNVTEKGKLEADGILDIFDRYNFTMSEDEPMEREVAIDPEMLGKVFENLLDVKDRKSKGAFYTPREIVHYMCQESLVKYLTRTMKIDEESIRDFIVYGDFMKDEDTVKEKRLGNKDMFISEELYKLDSSGNVIVDRLSELDEALKDVRVADPAVGSGAFPLGMLNEIVRARQNISAYKAINMNAYDTRMMYQMERSPHTLKYETIRNCIFASDVEPSAVDITQLRLWLALVIDDEINPDAQSILDGHRNPLPLPNLECNILCGNSLSTEFEGLELINESKIIGTSNVDRQYNIFQGSFESILPQLIQAQDDFFRCDSTERKHELKEKIESLRQMIILSQLKGQLDRDGMERYEATKSMASKPFVLWQLDFARVFRDKGGFDIVIGNPPYLESRNPSFSDAMKDELQSFMKKRYGKNAGWFARGCDLLIYFFELSLRLINQNGLNTFITQNSWLDTEFGKKFQEYLLRTTNVVAIIDSDYKYFDTADINTIITFFEGKQKHSIPALFARSHKSCAHYHLPANALASIDEKDVTYKVIEPDNALLSDMKWGFIFETDPILLKIISKANKAGLSLDNLKGKFEIGQGLNLKKSSVITSADARKYDVPAEALIPFCVTEEGGIFAWTESEHFLLNKSKLSSEAQKILKKEGYDLFDPNATRKKPPVLIMPRGLGARHFCCLNEINGFSASCVDIYASTGVQVNDDVIRLWTYFNSSLCWLIREIAGRKNLGGGMLKAEAVDLKPFAILYKFSNVDEARSIYSSVRAAVASNAQDEILKDYHQKIDKLIFDYIGLDNDERLYVQKSLKDKVDARYNKTKNK